MGTNDSACPYITLLYPFKNIFISYKAKKPITKVSLHGYQYIATVAAIANAIAAILQMPFHMTLQMLFPTLLLLHICSHVSIVAFQGW